MKAAAPPSPPFPNNKHGGENIHSLFPLLGDFSPSSKIPYRWIHGYMDTWMDG